MKFTRRDAIKLLGSAYASPSLSWLSPQTDRKSLKRGLEDNRTWNSDWQFQHGPDESGSALIGPDVKTDARSIAPHDIEDRSTLLPYRQALNLSEEWPPARWENVNLPHYGEIQGYNVSRSYQGICWYRKKFVPDASMRNRNVTLEFEAAMQQTDVWIDGKFAVRHAGGYLPFFLDLTDLAGRQQAAEITVRLDNRDNPTIPPGKPQAQLDFCYFPGLYRNVRLHITDKLHITDAVEADRTAGGGIFVRYENVSTDSADLLVSVHVVNQHDQSKAASLVVTLRDADGSRVGQYTSPQALISSKADHIFAEILSLPHPKLWSPSNPYLYRLDVQVVQGERVIDERSLQIGIRTLRTDPRLGFFLNGLHFVPSGANRHQAYPYVGNALSDQAQYRDALLLKEAGYELIRLSHYPQSPAFMDACDELGLMTITCIPGWQFFGNTEEFRQNVRQNLRDLIRRDRNHACSILWECSLNETGDHDEFIRELVEIAHEEYPGDQMLTCGDTEGHDYDKIRYDVPYSGWDEKTHSRPSLAHGAMSLHREYGDNQFGGYSRYSRGDGERLMLVQAWNYQTALNEQLGLSYTWGQCAWEAFDNNRGMSPLIATCGALDLFRLPKFLYSFFQSQRDPYIVHSKYDSGPMVFIANYWMADSPRDVVVFSNCDEVGLTINGRLIDRRAPDNGPDVKFGDSSGFNLDYWMTNSGIPKDERKHEIDSPVYNGGNCRKLVHAPFTFAGINFEIGELKAVGYLRGDVVATMTRSTPGIATKLEVQIQARGCDLIADGSDMVFVHAMICDARGTVVPNATDSVQFEVSGPAILIGDNPRNAEAGIASILMQSTGGSGRIKVQANAANLGKGETIVKPQDPLKEPKVLNERSLG